MDDTPYRLDPEFRAGRKKRRLVRLMAFRDSRTLRWSIIYVSIYNVIISNVPGPSFPLFIAGAEVVGLYPVGLVTEGTGLNITVFSSNGTMNLGLLACPDLVPDLDAISRGISEALDRLASARP